MKSKFGMKWVLATAGLALLLAAGGCMTSAPKGDYVAPPLGSTFTYTVRTTGSYGSGNTQVTFKQEMREWEGKPIRASVSPQGATLYNASSGGWVASLGPDGKPVIRFDPPLNWPRPLVVGNTSTTSYRVTVYATNQTTSFDATVKVEAYEDVTVPAGTFKVFRVSWSDTNGNENMEYSIPELGAYAKRSWRRTDKHAAGPGTREIELVSYTIAK